MSDFDLNAIDTILAKPYEERTEEETQLIIEWRVAQELKSAEIQAQYDAIQQQLADNAAANETMATNAETTLADLKNRALQLFEQAGL